MPGVICVKEGNIVTLRMFPPDISRSTWTAVRWEADYLYPFHTVFFAQSSGGTQRLITTCIINKKYFDGLLGLIGH